jgi:hypothetical protein
MIIFDIMIRRQLVFVYGNITKCSIFKHEMLIQKQTVHQLSEKIFFTLFLTSLYNVMKTLTKFVGVYV